MRKIFNTFNELYKLPKDTPFKFTELWQALLEEFKDVAFSSHDDVINHHGQLFPKSYYFAAERNCDDYNYFTLEDDYFTLEEALCGWFIEYVNSDIRETLKTLVEDVYNEHSS